MTLTSLFKRRPETSDETLAEELREAVETYNKAYRAVKAAGLSLGVSTCKGYSFTYIYGDLKVEYINRRNSKEL